MGADSTIETNEQPDLYSLADFLSDEIAECLAEVANGEPTPGTALVFTLCERALRHWLEGVGGQTIPALVAALESEGWVQHINIAKVLRQDAEGKQHAPPVVVKILANGKPGTDAEEGLIGLSTSLMTQAERAWANAAVVMGYLVKTGQRSGIRYFADPRSWQ